MAAAEAAGQVPPRTRTTGSPWWSPVRIAVAAVALAAVAVAAAIGVGLVLTSGTPSPPPPTRGDLARPEERSRVDYLMCTPEMARAMISRWISLVPSKMVKIFDVNAFSLFRAVCGARNPALAP